MKSFRQRVGTAYRRSTSFMSVGGSRPGTPSVKSDSDDPFAQNGASSVPGSPPRAGSIISALGASRPPSVHAEEQGSPPQAGNEQPSSAQQDQAKAEAVAADQLITNDSSAPSANEASPEPATEVEVAPEPPRTPPPEALYRETTEAQSAAPTPVAPRTPVRETNPELPIQLEPRVQQREVKPEEVSPVEPSVPAMVDFPVSDSPKSMSRKPSLDSLTQPLVVPKDATPAAPAPPPVEVTKTTPKPIIVAKPSRESLRGPNLSPIRESEERTPIVAYFPKTDSQAASKGPDSSALPSPSAPILGTKISSTSDIPTPRPAAPLALPATLGGSDKGKEREPTLPAYLPPDGYFSKAAPATLSAPLIDQHAYIEDPFRDPDTPVATSTHDIQQHENRDDAYGDSGIPSFPVPQAEPVSLPLPPLNEVTTRAVRNMPSDYTLAAHSSKAPSVHNDPLTDETRPLLSRPANNGHANIESEPTDFPSTETVGSPSITSPYSAVWTDGTLTPQSLGWVAHVLPDTAVYYTHPLTRVTTDIDLTNPRKLRAVAAYLDRKIPNEMSIPPENSEVWLRNESVIRGDFVPVRCWINHSTRTLSYVSPDEVDGRGVNGDHLDQEYRYWSFMETHPSHTPLPENAYAEALDVLTWSYSDRVLKAHPASVPPFKQHECQELMGVLRSLSASESPVQASVQTRIVSRILRRIVQWKQHHFRPDKPLPRDAYVVDMRLHRGSPVKRTFIDFILAWLCFGIPYLYANRHGYQRFDEESGLMRTAGPVLVMGASVSLVAAIVLSAAVTFLALPGLDNFSRTAGFVAAVGSIASLASSVIALFRHQVELQRMAMRGGEGIVVAISTGGSILMSLPAIFLAWSVIAFLTGLVLYAFRGVIVVDPSHWAKFAAYTKWTTLGVLGFSAGIFVVSAFFARG